ncbi:MAG: SHOCT domain-containing protein [Phycisphaerae bacterium]|nr:SHOCT domain-containing protein [Phycisphaerae bacterium]
MAWSWAPASVIAAKGKITWPDVLGILTWGAAIIVLLVVAALVFNWLRRRIDNRDIGSTESNAWTLADLRQLQADGLLSDEEYAKLKKAVIESLGGKVADPASRPVLGPADAGDSGAKDTDTPATPGDPPAPPAT